MKILGIETTCDDTAIALIDNGKIIFELKFSSEKLHSVYGGIVPEIAARKHYDNVILLLKKIMLKKNFKIQEIDYIAYASEPGLAGSLHVGKIFAQSLSYILKKKIIKINHIYAHCFSAFINKKEIIYPFISLIASGGTTSLFLIKSPFEIIHLSKKKDDALGEAYDKIGRLLNLKYPGGPNIDKIYNEKFVKKIFKKQKLEDDFSFSGAKSKIKNLIDYYKKRDEEVPVVMLASSFQYWAINLLIDKINFYNKKFSPKFITIGGGVARNSFWRKEIKKIDVNFLIPTKKYCNDNAAMIAFLAWCKLK